MSKSTAMLLILTGTVAVTALGSALLIVAAPASAQQAEPGMQQPREKARIAGATGDVRTATAKVEGIDKEKRTLTLKTEQGKTTTVTVPEDVQAFDRIKKGDKIKMSYQESVAVAVHRPGEARPEEKTKETTQQIEGAQPGRMMERTQTISAEVVSVDTKRNILKVKGPQGKIKEITVQDPDMREKLKDLKVGEIVEVAYNEAMAVTLEPSK
jgi:hypothetical protein